MAGKICHKADAGRNNSVSPRDRNKVKETELYIFGRSPLSKQGMLNEQKVCMERKQRHGQRVY